MIVGVRFSHPFDIVAIFFIEVEELFLDVGDIAFQGNNLLILHRHYVSPIFKLIKVPVGAGS